MDFGLSDHRLEVQRWAAGLSARLGGTGYARGLREDPGVARAGYAELAAAGLAELGFGENDAFDRALVYEQLGSGLIISPAMDSAVFAAEFLSALPQTRAGELLRQVRDGVATVALAPQVLALGGGAEAGSSDPGLSGLTVRTPWFDVASHVLVPERDASGTVGVAFVPIAEFTTAGRGCYMNTLPVGELSLPAGWQGRAGRAGRAGEDTERFAGEDVRTALEKATAAMLGVVAAFCLGGARRAVSLASDYAKQRHQFGRPIGSFQAQQHKLATAELRVRQAQHLVYAAADSPAGPEASFYAAAASNLALRAFCDAAQTASLVHGGYGLALEFDIHLYFVYSKILETLYGPVAMSRLRRAVLWTSTFEPTREIHA